MFHFFTKKYFCAFKINKRFAFLLPLFFLIANSAFSQNINKAEYFFDTDPGVGNGTSITFTTPADSINFTATINTTGLATGNHFLFVRTRTTAGVWSLYEPQFFYIKNSVVKAEYFFDIDPGVGNGTNIAIASTVDSLTFTSSINTTGLLPGSHFLFVRTKDEKGVWSLYQHSEFFIRQSIAKAEYFFDTDPGVGNGTAISITPTYDSITFTNTISTTGLTDGLHFLFVRTKNEKGVWSLYQPQEFYVRNLIEAAEYFFDIDPGVGLGIPISIPATTDSITFTSAIVTPLAITNGPHYLFIRTRDSKKIWSLYEPIAFDVDVTLPIEWLSFTAVKQNKNAILKWSSSSETNCLKYEIEKTTDESGFDASHFSFIGSISGNGTTSSINNYDFTDSSITYSGIHYYRIKQIDTDGKFSYSEIRSLDFNTIAAMKIYPNPGAHFFTLDIGEVENVTNELLIYNNRGQLVLSEKNISSPYQFGENLENGIYYVHVKTNLKTTIFKVVKTH